MNILDTFGSKELYAVELKSTLNIEIGGRTFAPGETVLRFDSLQLSVLGQQKTTRSSRGGYGNSELVTWEDTNGVTFICEKGVASQLSMSIMTNSKLVEHAPSTITIPFSEALESDLNGELILKFNPLEQKFFIHALDGTIPTYTKVYNVENNTTSIIGLTAYTNYIVSYLFTYTGESNVLNIGQRLFNGYLELTARMRLKDDTTGTDTTGILIIPNVRLVSDLSIRLGENAIPMVSTFRLQGNPVGERNNRYVCQIIYLDGDIDNYL